MPLFVALSLSDGGRFENGRIEFVPVTEPVQMTALLGNRQVDGMVGFIAQTANIFRKGEVDNLRLISVPLWRAFYVIGAADVTSWADIQGEVVLMPDAQSGPSQLAQASMEQAGLDPESDFEIRYLPASQIIQMMMAGQASAAVVSEPFSTILINKSRQEGGVPLDIAPMNLYEVFQAESAWPADTAPMEGFLALQETLDDSDSLALLQEFEAAYYDAIEFMQDNPAEASELIVEQLGEHCDSNAEARPLELSIGSGRMLYNPHPAVDLLPDLASYIEEVTGHVIDDSFYAAAGVSVAPGAEFTVATDEPETEPVGPNPDWPTLRVGAKCGPTPHAMPLFTMIGQNGIAMDGFNLEYVPNTDPAQMVALLSNSQIDVILGQLIQTAKMQATAVPDLRLWSISMSKGFYLMTATEVTGWADLVGERILLPGPTSGPTNLASASMRDAGYDPESDFAIEYLPVSQIVQLIVAGEAPAAVVSEPFVTMIINKSKKEGGAPVTLASIDLYSFYGSDKWEQGELPLDGVLVLQGVLDDREMRAAFIQFVTAYNGAIEFMLENPAEASKLIAAQLTEQCDSMMAAGPIEKTLASGRLSYAPDLAVDLLPDLDEYIDLVLGENANGAFYAEP
jgi:NitT/TauT family transport system substrate-binding protein